MSRSAASSRTVASGRANAGSRTNSSSRLIAGSILKNLAASWEFDTATGLLVDVHAGRNLTAVGTPSSVSGRLGEAIRNPDGTVIVRRDHEAALATGVGPWTVCGWFRIPGQQSIGENMLSKFDAPYENSDYELAFENNAGTLSVFARKMRNNDSVDAAATYPGYSGGWAMATGWFDPSQNRTWAQVNDGTAASATESHAWATITDGEAYMFGLGNPNAVDLDAVRLWKRILTSTERAWLYNSGSGRTYTEMRSYVS